MKSENIGGLVSLLGSCLFVLGGDKAGVLITAIFISAELTLARAGHLRKGYSLGCTLFALGDLIAVGSEIATGNRSFQIMLAIIGIAWGIGALRAPVVWFGHAFNKPKLADAGDALQLVIGTIILALRIPTLAAALIGGSYIGALAIGCWALADVLIGRLHDLPHLLRRLIG